MDLLEYRGRNLTRVAEILGARVQRKVEVVSHDGRVFNGHDGVREFFAEFVRRGEVFTASPYSFELHEPDLIVVGHRRIRSQEGMRGDYLFFVHSFVDGRVSRIAAHTTKDAALTDIAARYRGRAWPS